MTKDGLGFTNPITKDISVNRKFLKELDAAGRRELENTIIHESIHRTRPYSDMWTRPFVHPDIYDEADKRTREVDRTFCY